MAVDRVVIDSGFLLESILPTRREQKHAADQLIEAMADRRTTGVVPYLFFHELAAVCARKQRARQVAADDVAMFLEAIDACGFTLDLTILSPSDLYRQALKLGCQVSDAVFVALAKANGIPLATVDGGMKTAARAAGVELWKG